MFCSTNFKTKKNIDVCCQKMLSCLSNAMQRKVNSLKFAYVLNSNAQYMICQQEKDSEKIVCVWLPCEDFLNF